MLGQTNVTHLASTQIRKADAKLLIGTNPYGQSAYGRAIIYARISSCQKLKLRLNNAIKRGYHLGFYGLPL